MSTISAQLDAMERHATFWGGEVGAKLRNHVRELRAMLGLD